MAHISVNTLNEYLDYKSGIDLNTNRTAFSGGSGALPNNPEMLKTIFTVGVISLLITLLIGVFFIWIYGWQLFPIGIVGLILVVAYTRWVNRYPWLCLIAPGFGFGVLMTVGANFAVTGFFNDKLWLISLVPFFLVNNLLLLNQYPDIDADKAAGRNHFPIAYGVSASNTVYFVFLLLTMLVIIIGVLIDDSLPDLSLIALLAILPGFYALSGAIKFKEAIGQHSQYLVANVLVSLLVPVLLGITILFG
ncbi:1,4-dihydroxy-2-naphthoate polyprenyltransferase [uncultured Candidatus Thioglobus sp.]|nr:1,4-dihydroxy-2-naphthoate polyprenyltransferase [uncultured Candidatus Thioglobus sp.]